MKRLCLIISFILLSFLLVWYRLKPDQQGKARTHQVPFPFSGYFLVNGRDELCWYRVSVPENMWTKIADGSFMLAEEFSVVTKNGNYTLSKIEGEKIHRVDVRTGKRTFTSLSANHDKDDKETFTLDDYHLAWNGQAWDIKHKGKHWTIPNSEKKLLAPSEKVPSSDVDYMEPCLFVSPNEVIFIKTHFPTSTSVLFDYVVVDSLTGKSRNVMRVPENSLHSISDQASRRIYFLKENGLLEGWAWSGRQLVKEKNWHLPPAFPDEYNHSLVTVINQEWMVYKTILQKTQWGIIAMAPLPKYYAFNLRSGQWASLLDPPGEHSGDIIAWIAK